MNKPRTVNAPYTNCEVAMEIGVSFDSFDQGGFFVEKQYFKNIVSFFKLKL